MKVRRKSLWRSKNNSNARKFANRRAAKERKRLERANAPDVMPDVSHVFTPKPAKPLFIVTVKCSDGETVKMRIYEGPHGLTISATDAGRRVAAILKNYRPATQACSVDAVNLRSGKVGVSRQQGRSAV